MLKFHGKRQIFLKINMPTHSTNPVVIAQTIDGAPIFLDAGMLNRHLLITGATGTGKSLTLQSLAERLSNNGIAVFLSDIKGDLSGLAKAAVPHEKLLANLKKRHIKMPEPGANTVYFWDVFQKEGIALRATISDLGPILLARLLKLNDTQASILQLVFRIADEKGLLLIDVKDLKKMLAFVQDNLKTFKEKYGQIHATSLQTIARNVLNLEDFGADLFFGEPALNIADLFQTDENGCGIIHILESVKLIQTPIFYGTVLLWLLSNLYENLPEVGDLKQPKMVFFFDEAHLLFKNAPNVLLEKVEQVVRLIRSKGVGVCFVTQNPADIPDAVAGQLGNRIQHALRAFTPKDQKAVKVAAQSLRANPKMNTETVIGELKTGEALVSTLNSEGEPQMVERAFILPPSSFLGALTANERQVVLDGIPIFKHYGNYFDRESAYEKLSRGNFAADDFADSPKPAAKASRAGRASKSFLDSALQSFGRTLGRALVRGILGSLTRKK